MIKFYQILSGSFSAGSTPIFATKDSFCSAFRDLQELRSKLIFFVIFYQTFCNLSCKSCTCCDFRIKFVLFNFSTDFDENLSEFSVCFGICVPNDRTFQRIANFDGFGVLELPKQFRKFPRNPRFSDLGVTGGLQPFPGSWSTCRTLREAERA